MSTRVQVTVVETCESPGGPCRVRLSARDSSKCGFRRNRALGLFAHGPARVLTVARTIADPAGESRIWLPRLAEAIRHREQGRSTA